jgi:ribosomal protein S18 acetylase RimI-like enzyme
MADVTELTLELCSVTDEAAARQILEWRNDPVTLSMFFHRTPKTVDEFWREYQRDYFVDPNLPPLFVLDGDRRVSFLRFKRIADPSGRCCCDISINVAPTARGKRLGSRSLLVAAEFLRSRGVDEIVAEIRVENTASVRSFENAGFGFHERTNKLIADTGEDCAIVVYRKQLS